MANDISALLEDDKVYGRLAEAIRARRMADNRNPDTGLPIGEMKIMSWEYLDAQEKRRTEEVWLSGRLVEPKPTMGDLARQLVRDFNQRDPSVVATIPAGEAEVKTTKRLPHQPTGES